MIGGAYMHKGTVFIIVLFIILTFIAYHLFLSLTEPIREDSCEIIAENWVKEASGLDIKIIDILDIPVKWEKPSLKCQYKTILISEPTYYCITNKSVYEVYEGTNLCFYTIKYQVGKEWYIDSCEKVKIIDYGFRRDILGKKQLVLYLNIDASNCYEYYLSECYIREAENEKTRHKMSLMFGILFSAVITGVIYLYVDIDSGENDNC